MSKFQWKCRPDVFWAWFEVSLQHSDCSSYRFETDMYIVVLSITLPTVQRTCDGGWLSSHVREQGPYEPASLCCWSASWRDLGAVYTQLTRLLAWLLGPTSSPVDVSARQLTTENSGPEKNAAWPALLCARYPCIEYHRIGWLAANLAGASLISWNLWPFWWAQRAWSPAFGSWNSLHV